MKLSRLFIAGVSALAIIGTVGVTAAQNSIDEILRIGVIVESGSQGDTDNLQAALLAAEGINNDEGVVAPNGTRYGFEILSYEVETTADATEALEDAVNNNAVAVIGPNDAGLADALDASARPSVPVLLTSSASPDASYLYRIAADYTTWAETAADYLANVRHYDRIVLLTGDTENAVAARDAFNAAVDDTLIAADIQIDSEAERLTSEAQTIKDADAQALFVWVLDAQMIALQEALDNVRWDGLIIYAGLDAGYIERAGSEQVASLFGIANWTSSAYDADSQAFTADFIAQAGTQPGESAVFAYDAVSLIAAAVDNSGITPDAIANWVSSVGTLEGVAGSYTLGVSDTVRLVQAQEGRMIEAARYNDEGCTNCPSIWTEDTTGDDVEDSATVRLGLITTANDSTQFMADSLEQAAELAIREINAAGGAVDASGTRYTLSLNVYQADTADEAEAAMQEAASDGVRIVLGPEYNGQVLPNLDDAESASIIQFTSAASDEITLNESSSFVFQVRSTDSTLARAAADYLVNTRDFTRLATVGVNASYGIDSINMFTDVVGDSNEGEVVLALEHDVADTDLTALAQQIADANVEAVAVWTTQPAALNLLTTLEAQGWNGVFVYGYLTPDFVEASASASVELVGPVSWWSSAQDWASRDFTARYVERYNSQPYPQSAAYYDAVYLIQNALSESSAEVSDVQDWLLSQSVFVGVQGTYAPETYNTGELIRAALIVQAAGGQVTELSRYQDDVCLSVCGS